MRRKIVLGIILTFAMLIMMFGVLPVKAQKTRVLIGWAHPLSGPAASGAAIHHAYYKMIIQDYNAKGGLYLPEEGKRVLIEYIEYDDEYNLDNCIRLYEKLITEDRVDLCFAPWSTAFNVAIFPLLDAHQYPIVGLTVGSDSFSEAAKRGEYPWCFITLGVPWEDGEELAELFTYINENTKEEWKIDEVGIIYQDDEHGIEHANGIKGKLEAIGISVPVFIETSWMSPPTDWAPIISQLRAEDVDVVFWCGYGHTGGWDLMRACITLDYNPKLLVIGPNMELSLLMFTILGFTYGQTAGVLYYNGFPSTNFKSVPEYWEWAIEHEQRLGYLPFPASLSFYCGLECLLIAAEEHGLDRAKIRDALETETFNTKAGKYKFRVGQSPEIENHGTLSQWQGGELMEVVWPPDKKTSSVIYPKFPWSWAEVPDVKRDGIVNILDISIAAKAYGTSAPLPRSPRWDPAADIDGNGLVNILDLAKIAKAFGTKVTYPF